MLQLASGWTSYECGFFADPMVVGYSHGHNISKLPGGTGCYKGKSSKGILSGVGGGGGKSGHSRSKR